MLPLRLSPWVTVELRLEDPRLQGLLKDQTWLFTPMSRTVSHMCAYYKDPDQRMMLSGKLLTLGTGLLEDMALFLRYVPESTLLPFFS